MAGLYFHIPFCRRICAYCDFYRQADLRPLPEVVGAMHAELEREAGWLGERTLRTVYFGGGTPSLLGAGEVREFLRSAARLFDCGGVEEVTLEANPDDLSPAYLEALREAGVDRLSVGVQSFDDDELRLMNRRHTGAQAEAALRAAREAGFDNLTADLIFGVPGFGSDTVRRSVERLAEAGVDHVSAYHLTVEPRTLFGRRMARGNFRPVDEAVSEEEFLLVHDLLTAAGYEHYEVSNYARPGRRARHNGAYWRGERYLGIGPSAHSYNGIERRWAVSSVAEYLAGAPYGSERPDAAERYDEYVMTRLRTADGIELEEVRRLFGEGRLEYLLREAAPWLASGDLLRGGGRMRIPAERFLRSDAVIADLFALGD